MKKLLSLGIFAVFTLFLPRRSQAVPLDIPYYVAVDTVAIDQDVILSTTIFKPANTGLTVSTSTYNWCLSHLAVSGKGVTTTVSFFWGQESTTAGTTDYEVNLSSGVPYDTQWAYKTPYCAPTGNNALHVHSSAGGTITLEGYLFGGWNNP